MLDGDGDIGLRTVLFFFSSFLVVRRRIGGGVINAFGRCVSSFEELPDNSKSCTGRLASNPVLREDFLDVDNSDNDLRAAAGLFLSFFREERRRAIGGVMSATGLSALSFEELPEDANVCTDRFA